MTRLFFSPAPWASDAQGRIHCTCSPRLSLWLHLMAGFLWNAHLWLGISVMSTRTFSSFLSPWIRGHWVLSNPARVHSNAHILIHSTYFSLLEKDAKWVCLAFICNYQEVISCGLVLIFSLCPLLSFLANDTFSLQTSALLSFLSPISMPISQLFPGNVSEPHFPRRVRSCHGRLLDPHSILVQRQLLTNSGTGKNMRHHNPKVLL